VREEVGEEHDGLTVKYVEQTERNGTGDAVELAEENDGESFVVVNGDVFFSSEVMERLVSQEGNSVSVKRVEDPSEYGVVEVSDRRATRIVEKPDEPPPELASAGVYVFDNRVFDYLRETTVSQRGERELTDAVADMLEDGVRFGVVEHDAFWLDVGYPWNLLEANGHVLGSIERRLDGTVEEGATVKGNVVVEEGAHLLSGAYVEGPALVRRGAEVGPNAYVRGSSVVGEGVHVGHSVEVKNSVLMRGVSVRHLSYVGDSVLGEDVNFGAGTVVANLRHDNENVRAQVKGKVIDTERRKFGVIVGDGAKTGVNTSLNAGVRLGVGATTEPGEAVTRDKGVEDL